MPVFHTAISAGAAANAATVNAPLAEIDTKLAVAHDADGNLKAGAVTTAGVLGADVVTTVKILDANVTGAKIAAATITGDKIAASAVTVPNLVRDGFNRTLAAGENDQRERWQSPADLTLIDPDASNPYGAPTLRFIGAAVAASGGRRLWLDEMGLAPGNTVTFSADVYATAGTYSLRVQFYDSSETVIASGGTFSGTTTSVTARTTLTTPLATIPATAAYCLLYIQRVTGTTNIDIYAMWSGAANFIPSMPTPGPLDAVARLQQSTYLALPDPFNEDLTTTATLASSWGGRLRWQNAVTLSAVTPDAANPYGRATLRYGTTAATGGWRFWFDELGVKVGDVLHFGVEALAASDQFRLCARFFNSGGTLINTQINGSTRTFTGTVRKLTVGNLTVPATAAGIAIYANRVSGTVNLDIYSHWGSKGTTMLLQPPAFLESQVKAEIVAARSIYADLATRLTAMGTGAFPAAQDTYGRHFLRDWNGQLAKIQQAVAGEQAVIAVFGDSWVNNAYITGPLRTWLQTTYGNAGPGWTSFYTGHTEPTGITRLSAAGTWTDSDQAATSAGVDIAHTTSSDTATPGTRSYSGTFTDVTIHYLKTSGGGSFRWRIDAGGWTTVSTANATDLFATVVITGLSNASHTLTIEVTVASTAGVTLMGADFQIAGNGVRLHKIGNGGLTAGQSVAVDATIWQAGIAALAPNLAIILLGTNDDSADVAPATFGTQVATLVSRIRAARSRTDILLLSPTGNGLAAGTYALSQYVSQLRDQAVALDAAMVDFYLTIPDYTIGNTRGLYTNTTHLNANGGQVGANLLARFLRAP